MEETNFELHALLVTTQQKCDASARADSARTAATPPPQPCAMNRPIAPRRRARASALAHRRPPPPASLPTAAVETELTGARRRAALQDEHYSKQEDAAAKLAAENRIYLERMHSLLASTEDHKKQIEVLQNENAQMSASLTVLRERASLAKTLSALGPQLEALKGASSRQESPGRASFRVDFLSSPRLPRRPNGFLRRPHAEQLGHGVLNQRSHPRDSKAAARAGSGCRHRGCPRASIQGHVRDHRRASSGAEHAAWRAVVFYDARGDSLLRAKVSLERVKRWRYRVPVVNTLGGRRKVTMRLLKMYSEPLNARTQPPARTRTPTPPVIYQIAES